MYSQNVWNGIHVSKRKNIAKPVSSHSHMKNWVIEDSRCPFNRMNFGHQGRIDQMGMAKEPIVIPVWVLLFEMVTNDIVFFDIHAEPAQNFYLLARDLTYRKECQR